MSDEGGYVRLEGTAMVFRRSPDSLVFERDRGWISTDQLKPGDFVSAHRFPPRFYKVIP